jgi:hypothetical protein
MSHIDTSIAVPPAETKLNIGALAQKSVLIGLTISQWTARKQDKRVSKEVADNHGATAGAGRYHKALLARSSLADINAIVSEARVYHYKNTLPWLDDGKRLKPTAAFLPYMDAMRAYKTRFETAVRNFVLGYPDFVSDARRDLGSLFSDADYPKGSTIARRFAFDLSVGPVPVASDFRVDLNGEEVARIRAEIEAATGNAFQGAVQDQWVRMHDVVGKMVERLSAYSEAQAQPETVGPDGKKVRGTFFKDSLVENVRELVGLLPGLNVTGDPILTKMVRRMDDKLCWHDADDLRDDASARNNVLAEAQSILDEIGSYYTPAPSDTVSDDEI